MLKKWMALGCLVGASMAHAFVPQTGTWVVSEELNGKPGRGLAIDVQDTTLVMQMYAYDASGNATFYLTSGTINNNQYSGALNKYKGGRYLGSGDRSGQDAGNDGVVSMRFESGTVGYIKFPGEAEKQISRFNFAYGANPQSLKGAWLFASGNDNASSSDIVGLVKDIGPTSYGTGTVTTQDGRFACENMVRGPNAGRVVCVKLNASGALTRIFAFYYSVNDGEGWAGPTATTANDMLFVRRITNANIKGTGIFHRSGEVQDAIDPEVLREALEQAASEPLPQ